MSMGLRRMRQGRMSGGRATCPRFPRRRYHTQGRSTTASAPFLPPLKYVSKILSGARKIAAMSAILATVGHTVTARGSINPMGRSRTRRMLKWVGMAACVLLLGSLVASWRWSLLWVDQAREARFQVAWGGVWMMPDVGWAAIHVMSGPQPDPGWHVWDSEPGRRIWLPVLSSGYGGPSIAVPFWLPLIILGCPTAYLWWRNTKRPPKHCCQHCGYNLTGNVSGKCPECGQRIEGAAPG